MLSARWLGGGCPSCDERLAPFPGRPQRPPLTPEEAAEHTAHVVDGTPYLAVPTLVAAGRPADVPAVIEWMGSYNWWQDTVGMSAVLRAGRPVSAPCSTA